MTRIVWVMMGGGLLSLAACGKDGGDQDDTMVDESGTDQGTDSGTDGGTDGGDDTGTDSDSGTTGGDSGTDDTGATSGTAPEACGNAVTLADGGHWLQEDLFGSTELVDLPHEQGPGVALGDFDGDGWLDALMTVGVERSLAFKNDGAGQLAPTDAFTVDGGVFPPANALATGDFDGDGDLDIVLSMARDHDDLVLFNDGAGAFTSVALPDSQNESMTPTVADFDGDGDLDLFLAGFTAWLDPRAVMDGEQVGDGQKLYHWEDGAFVDASSDLSPSVDVALTFQGAVLDYDADGDLDLYLANDYSQYVVISGMLANNGEGQLAEVQANCGLQGTIMGVTVGDANGDGLPDLFITDWGRVFLFINLGDGTFYEASAAQGIDPDAEESLVGWASVFVDIDGDADLDLATMFGPVIVGDAGTSTVPPEQPDTFFLNGGDAGFSEVSDGIGFNDMGIGRSVASGDLDRDGRPDLVVAGRVYLRSYLTRGGCDAGVTLLLDDEAMNRQGIGARVDAEIGGETLTRWMLPSTSFGASAAELHLGLGGAAQADRVTVTWLDGRTTVLTNVAAGTRALVTPSDD